MKCDSIRYHVVNINLFFSLIAFERLKVSREQLLI